MQQLDIKQSSCDVGSSFTAAGSYPIKALLNRSIVENALEKKFVIPWHIQLNPTAVCEENCSWCSCCNRDRKTMLSVDDCLNSLKVAKQFGGGGAVTITGDGNPTLHPGINEIVHRLHNIEVEISMVNNGWSIDRLDYESLQDITWMRISFGDGQRKKTSEYWHKLADVVEKAKIDFSFSYVLTSNPDLALLDDMISFANRYEFSHIRVVNDIFNAKLLSGVMEKTRKAIREILDDRLVIWQGRDEWTKGVEKCYCSLLRPVLGSDGYWYSCCGNQYMLADPSRRYVMPMSKYRCELGLLDIISNQRYFNGNVCEKCYYDSYNQLLKVLLSGIKHINFV